jgi:hypothetical protein
MTRIRILLTVAAAFLFCSAGANTHTDEAVQTDSSRGLGVYGPVSETGDTSSAKTDVDSFTYAGDPLPVLAPKTPVKHVVDDNFESTYSVQAVDVDGDGDIDVLGAAFWADEITWWSNDNGSGTSWTEHTIDGDFPRACSVYAAYINDDGYIDVLGAAFAGNDIAWWKNDGSGTSWVEHTIDGDVAGARSVYAADMDGDGDTDVLGAARSADGIIWWSNDDGSGTSWTEHRVDGDFDGARSVYAADIDDDGDMDVLGAAIYADDITWWSNDDGSGTSWTEYTVAGDFDGARSVYAEDVDGDGDKDILGAAGFAYDTTWWENNDGSGTSWIEHTIDGSFNNASSVYAADIDDDGDTDVLGATAAAYEIVWWENYDGSGTSWTEHTVGDVGMAWSVCAGDVDNDGDTDVLGAASVTNYITWWEVTGYTDGKLVSPMYDTEGSLEWGAVERAAGTPEGTAAESRVRNSSDAKDSAGWSPDITSPEDLGSYPTDGEYVQYKTTLKTANDGDTSILEGVDVNGTSDTFGTIERTWDGTLPTAYALYQSRPNPAKGNAVITFELPENAEVTLSVYDIRGREVKTLVDEMLTAGTYERTVSGLPGGVYMYRLSAGSFTAARKMVIVGADF